jgi:hypothetical protein
LPATPGDVLAQFVKLHLAALVGGADAGVEGDDHGFGLSHERSRAVAKSTKTVQERLDFR